jgi:UDP-N-acetylmuramoyl-tripeptide--D-alanyl-D-alanine ligase
MHEPLRIDRTFDIDEFVKAIGGRSNVTFDKKATGICLDTRILKKGDVFFAIQSERDGHEFVPQAIAKGAVACVVSKDFESDHQVLVPNTLKALWSYAEWVRNKWGKKIVALSGSNGKTSTKEIIGILLGEKTHKTPGTWNNYLGVPLTMLMLQDHHEFGVLEMGINHFGELRDLCSFSHPNIALLTNVGPAHLQEFKDLDGVALAKGEIFQGLKKGDVAVINMDDAKIAPMKSKIQSDIMTVSQQKPADISLVKKQKTQDGHKLSIQYGKDPIDVDFAMLGDHNVSNYLCALGVAKALNIPAKDIVQRTSKVKPVSMRMENVFFPDDRRLINDCYNANPGSFQAGLRAVSEMKPRRFLLLMGDMLEMGTESASIHEKVGQSLHGFGVEHAYVIGEFANDVAKGAQAGGMSQNQITIIEDRQKAAAKILSNFKSGDILLVKGSRGMKLENVIQDMQNQAQN